MENKLEEYKNPSYTDLDSLRPATELHVLDVAEGGVNVLHRQEVLVDLVNLLEVHVCLLEVCECEVEQRALVEDPRDGSLVQLPRLVQPLLAVVHVPLLL